MSTKQNTLLEMPPNPANLNKNPAKLGKAEAQKRLQDPPGQARIVHAVDAFLHGRPRRRRRPSNPEHIGRILRRLFADLAGDPAQTMKVRRAAEGEAQQLRRAAEGEARRQRAQADAELQQRRRVERIEAVLAELDQHLAQAGVPAKLCAARLDRCPDLPKTLIDAMRAWAAAPRGFVLFSGRPGCGKSWLSAATLAAVIISDSHEETDYRRQS